MKKNQQKSGRRKMDKNVLYFENKLKDKQDKQFYKRTGYDRGTGSHLHKKARHDIVGEELSKSNLSLGL